jgi:methylated-DNA-protein-cysteine methyltransferase-like protein
MRYDVFNMKGSFSQMVWELATIIPPGRVTTYGIIARKAGGDGQAARSVTGILAKAPNQNAIPYHRIVYADGRAWINGTNEKERRKLFSAEGIEIDDRGRIKDFNEILYRFDEEF